MENDFLVIVNGILNVDFQNISQNLIVFLREYDFSYIFYWTKVIFISISLFCLGVIIFTLKDGSYIKWLFWTDLIEFLNFKPYGVGQISKEWEDVRKRLKSGQESEYKLAVIEADMMLNEILKKMGYEGETLGERLNGMTSVTFSNISEIKSSHNIRNDIIHDPDYRLKLEETERVIFSYETALSDLEAL